MRNHYNFSRPENHDAVLPVLVVRDPYYWYVLLARLSLVTPTDVSKIDFDSHHHVRQPKQTHDNDNGAIYFDDDIYDYAHNPTIHQPNMATTENDQR